MLTQTDDNEGKETIASERWVTNFIIALNNALPLTIAPTKMISVCKVTSAPGACQQDGRYHSRFSISL